MTYSIVARDPATGQLGVAVQSRSFAAGRLVPWIEPGVGAIASQSITNPAYGTRGLSLLRSGQEPRQVLDRLVGEDPDRALRQVAILDVEGRVAVHTGVRCVAYAGHLVGASSCAQANMMKQDTIWETMVRAFEQADGHLADRLLVAMQAAEHRGGDLRGSQAAALVVVSGQASGAVELDRLVDLRVDDHPDPVGELARLLHYSRAQRRAERALGKARAGDPVGALEDLEACSAAYPSEPEFLFRRTLVLLALGRMADARESLAQANAIHPGWSELLLRFADAGMIPLGRETIIAIIP